MYILYMGDRLVIHVYTISVAYTGTCSYSQYQLINTCIVYTCIMNTYSINSVSLTLRNFSIFNNAF